tara:strand:+ start:252 stop:2519 length:2268 start_codon:yes stop_codon:yes gene_type:complete
MSEKDSLEELQELLSKAGLIEEPLQSVHELSIKESLSNKDVDDENWEKITDSPIKEVEKKEPDKAPEKVQKETPDIPPEPSKDQRADTEIVVDVSDNGMLAYITVDPGYRQKLTATFLERLLRFRGIQFGLIKSALERVAKRSHQGLRIIKVCVAKGEPAISGEAGSIQYYFEANLKERPKQQKFSDSESNSIDQQTFDSITSVRKGQIIAEKINPVNGYDGMDVRGQVIPHDPIEDFTTLAGPNTELQGLYVVALTDGRPMLNDSGTVSIKEIKKVEIEISRNNMEAFISINPRGKDVITPDIIEQKIKMAGISYGLNQNALETVFHRMQKGLSVKRLRIAEGLLPVPGSGGNVRYYFEHATLMKRMQQLNTEENQEITDYRSSHTIMMIRKDQLIAEKIDRKDGIDGKDVTGMTVDFLPVKDYPLIAGVNTELRGNQLYALCDGRPSFDTSGTVSVFEEFKVNGDLDLRIGNIEFFGDVEVTGNVLGGFKIVAGGNVFVRGSVEGAIIHSEKNIVINGSYSGGERGELKASEDVFLSHVNSGTIRTNRHLFVRRELVNANSYVKGNLYMGSRSSAIIGGKTYVSGEMNVYTLGSPLEVHTFISLGPQEFAKQDLNELKITLKEIDQRLELVQTGLDKIEDDTESGHLTTANRKQLDRHLKASLRRLNEKKSDLIRRKESLNETLVKNHTSFLRVAKRVNPGVRLKIGHASVRIEAFKNKVEFFENHRNKKVEMRPLNMDLFRMEPEESEKDGE